MNKVSSFDGVNKPEVLEFPNNPINLCEQIANNQSIKIINVTPVNTDGEGI